jgi:hypothetical protein
MRPSLWRRVLHSVQAWPRSTFGTLDLIPDGFEFTERNAPMRILWSEITRIDAGMRDYLTVDLFFTVIHTAHETARIDELVDGFRHLETSVFAHWPEVRDRWLALQGTPHHQPQCETLWQA